MKMSKKIQLLSCLCLIMAGKACGAMDNYWADARERARAHETRQEQEARLLRLEADKKASEDLIATMLKEDNAITLQEEERLSLHILEQYRNEHMAARAQIKMAQKQDANTCQRATKKSLMMPTQDEKKNQEVQAPAPAARNNDLPQYLGDRETLEKEQAARCQRAIQQQAAWETIQERALLEAIKEQAQERARLETIKEQVQERALLEAIKEQATQEKTVRRQKAAEAQAALAAQRKQTEEKEAAQERALLEAIKEQAQERALLEAIKKQAQERALLETIKEQAQERALLETIKEQAQERALLEAIQEQATTREAAQEKTVRRQKAAEARTARTIQRKQTENIETLLSLINADQAPQAQQAAAPTEDICSFCCRNSAETNTQSERKDGHLICGICIRLINKAAKLAAVTP